MIFGEHGGGAGSAPTAAEPASGRGITATVAICAYTDRRWEILVEAVEAVGRQLSPGDELLVVIDHAPELLALARQSFHGATVLANAHSRGLSGARNTAVEAASCQAVVFLDDDAVPEPGWLESLLAPYGDDSVLGVGGFVVPQWPQDEPWWLPPEFLWVVGCSYEGLPGRLETIRNPIGASMAYRRSVFAQTGLFSEALGRVGTVPVGCEETELSLRVASAFPEGRIVHEPRSVVRHQVSEDRTTFSYFRRRCWSEGASKAVVSRITRGGKALATERAYVLGTLRKGAARELARAARGDARGLMRLLALFAGAAITAVSYLSHLGLPPANG